MTANSIFHKFSQCTKLVFMTTNSIFTNLVNVPETVSVLGPSSHQTGWGVGPQHSHIVDIQSQVEKMKYYHINLTDRAVRKLWREDISGKI